MKELFSLLAFLIAAITGNAQTYGTDCLNAQPLGQGDTCVYNISVRASEYWISFVPDSSSVTITLANDTSSSEGHVHRIIAYALI